MKIEEIDISGYDTILLDRDGTINVHIIGDYVRKWEDFEFIPNVVDTIARWSNIVKHIFIVTNQRGIGKGKYTEEDLSDIHSHMVAEIENAGGEYIYAYSPEKGLQDPDIATERTVMSGDGDVDRDFANNSGIDFIRVDSLKRDGNKKYWIHTVYE